MRADPSSRNNFFGALFFSHHPRSIRLSSAADRSVGSQKAEGFLYHVAFEKLGPTSSDAEVLFIGGRLQGGELRALGFLRVC